MRIRVCSLQLLVFKGGALKVAERHGVDLFTVRFDEDEPQLSSQGSFLVRHVRDFQPYEYPAIELSEPHLVYAIEKAKLLFEDGRAFELPSEASQMTYYAQRTDTSDGRKLAHLMEPVDPPRLNVAEEARLTIPVNPPVLLIPPDDYYFPAGSVSSIEIIIAGRLARSLSGNVRIEPTSFRCPVIYRNVFTGEETRYPLDRLPLNTEAPEAGGFYFLPHPLRYFHCKAVTDVLVTWEMVESFQNEQLVRVAYTQKLKYGAYYIPVSDKNVLKRLARRLSDYQALSGQ